MKSLFDLVGIVCLLGGITTCATAKTSINEGVGAIVFLIAVVALGVGAVLDRLQRIERAIAPPSVAPSPAPVVARTIGSARTDKMFGWGILALTVIASAVGYFIVKAPS